jgi:hypothetical protein
MASFLQRLQRSPSLRKHGASSGTSVVIEVKWPTTQKIERFTQVKANQLLTIKEDSGILKST